MTEPIGKGKKGEDVWIGDIWPSAEEIQDCMKYAMDPKTFQRLYSNLADANPMWTQVPSVSGQVYNWPKSTYIAERRSSRTFPCSRARRDRSAVRASWGSSATR